MRVGVELGLALEDIAEDDEAGALVTTGLEDGAIDDVGISGLLIADDAAFEVAGIAVEVEGFDDGALTSNSDARIAADAPARGTILV